MLKFDSATNDIVLSNGHRFYAHSAILGLRIDGQPVFLDGETAICEGFDGFVSEDEFTPEERREIAEQMVALWKKWGEL